MMSGPTKFEPHPICGLSANAQKLLNQSEARKWWKFSEVWAKLIRPREAQNELAKQIWA